MSEMVERVARAIARANNGDDFDRVDEAVRELYRDEARAAIEAMREPSEEMLRPYRFGEARAAVKSDWQTMIAAAL
jgi:hypothetical protein